jgi:hypothetical protein
MQRHRFFMGIFYGLDIHSIMKYLRLEHKHFHTLAMYIIAWALYRIYYV